MSDPTRWADDPDAPVLLRELLLVAREDPISAPALARVEARVLAPDGVAPAGLGTSAKLLVALALGGATLLALGRSDPRPNTAEMSAFAAPIAPRTAPVIASPVAVPAQPPASPVVIAPPVRTPRSRSLARSVAPPELSSPPPSASEAIDPFVESAVEARSVSPPVSVAPPEPAVDRTHEAALLLAARRALPSDPARALELTDRHRRSFAQGVLREEREVIAIRSLLALARISEADRRLRAFAVDHPGSSHHSALRRALAAARSDGHRTEP